MPEDDIFIALATWATIRWLSRRQNARLHEMGMPAYSSDPAVPGAIPAGPVPDLTAPVDRPATAGSARPSTSRP